MSELPVIVVTSLETADNGLTRYLGSLGLPADVLAAMDDRRKVINNLPDAIDRLSPDQRAKAYYISKLVAAAGAGLFDAGLTYLWDAVVADLRDRVARFDLEYFYDSAVSSTTDRPKFKTGEDLKNLEDSRLIAGCLTCGILTDVGYKHLDHIRDMRNWSSAAHPNNAEVGGLQLIGYLETCVKEVFSVEVAAHAVVAHQLLRNLRERTLATSDVPPIAKSLAELPNETSAALLRSVVGLYSDLKQGRNVIDNIRLVGDAIWKAAPEEARHEVGGKYAALSNNGDVPRKTRVREFLELVNGLTYLTDDQLTLELQEKVAQLESAHFGMNNFYNEPAIARDLAKLVPPTGAIPTGANEVYVRTLMFCAIGRTSGVANDASPTYEQLTTLFGDLQIKAFLHLPYERRMQSKLDKAMLAQRFVDFARWFESRTANKTVQAVLKYISGLTTAQVKGLANDTHYKRLLGNML